MAAGQDDGHERDGEATMFLFALDGSTLAVLAKAGLLLLAVGLIAAPILWAWISRAKDREGLLPTGEGFGPALARSSRYWGLAAGVFAAVVGLVAVAVSPFFLFLACWQIPLLLLYCFGYGARHRLAGRLIALAALGAMVVVPFGLRGLFQDFSLAVGASAAVAGALAMHLFLGGRHDAEREEWWHKFEARLRRSRKTDAGFARDALARRGEKADPFVQSSRCKAKGILYRIP